MMRAGRSRGVWVALLATLLVALLGGLGWLALSGGDGRTLERGASVDGTGAAPSDEGPAALLPAGAPEGTPEADDPEGRTEVGPRPRAPSRRKDGRLVLQARWRAVDPDGAPLPGLAFTTQAAAGRLLATSGSDGRFTVKYQGGLSPLRLASPEHALVAVEGLKPGDGEREHLVVAARALDLAGFATGDSVPVPGAKVELVAGLDVLAGLGLDGSASALPAFVRTDARGAFRLRGVPALPGAFLLARKQGYLPCTLPLPPVSDDGLRLRMERDQEVRDPDVPVLEGSVVHADGSPATAAEVRLGRLRAAADAQGRFALRITYEPDPRTPLIAFEEGAAPAVEPAFARDLRDGTAPDWVLLVLPGAHLSIGGVLIDAEDRPLAGWEVRLLGGQELGPDLAMLTAEELAAGRPSVQLTEADGTFELGGLRPGTSYRVRAYDRRTLLAVESEPLPAGTADHVLRVPAAGVRERVDGTVHGRDGAPLEGVRVRLGLVVEKSAGREVTHANQETFTDAEGAFALTDVPLTEVFLDVSGADVVPVRHVLAPDDPARDLRLEVARLFTMEAVDAGPEPADTLRLLDGAGTPLRATFSEKPGTSLPFTGRLLDGRSPRLSLSEDARTAVFLRAGEVLERVPLSPAPGEHLRVER